MNTTDPIFVAVAFAEQAHVGQYRKGTLVPYIVHPLSVARLVIEHGASHDAALAAVLHDTVEDTDVTIDDIAQRFGDTVAEYVDALTEPDKSAPWMERKQHTITTMQSAPMEILAISCADKIDNMRSTRRAYARVGEAVWQRFARPRDDQAWYYRAMFDVFSARLTQENFRPLVDLLAEEIGDVF